MQEKITFDETELHKFTNMVIDMVMDQRDANGQIQPMLMMAVSKQGAADLEKMTIQQTDSESLLPENHKKREEGWGISIAVMDSHFMQDKENKMQLTVIMAKMIHAAQPYAVAFCTEGFMRTIKKEEHEKYIKKRGDKRISEMPGSKEIMLINIES